MIAAHDIARQLAARIAALAADLLPNGHREGAEWRCGSVAGEAGFSLGVHLRGDKPGVWSDFAAGTGGDALDLVAAVLNLSKRNTLIWSRSWLGIDRGEAPLPPRPVPKATAKADNGNLDRWRWPWQAARRVAGTLAETYLRGRGLAFADRQGEVLRFARSHARKNPEGVLEHHPALLALLRDIATGEPCGIHNIFLRPDGSDRLRDKKGKTTTGRVSGAAVMLTPFEDVTMGLTIGEGVETCIALLMDGLAPAWALCGAGNLAKFPVLGGIEAVTIAADIGPAGEAAARQAAARWHKAGRETRIVFPAADDWAAGRRAAA